jgi:hypothetical protein
MTFKTGIALCVGIALGFAMGGAVQELLDAMKRSWAKRTAADCRSISIAIEQYRVDHGEYPPLDGDVGHLGAYLAPHYLRQVPVRDMSSQPYLVVMNGSKAVVISVGRYGAAVEAGTLIRGAPWLK